MWLFSSLWVTHPGLLDLIISGVCHCYSLVMSLDVGFFLGGEVPVFFKNQWLFSSLFDFGVLLKGGELLLYHLVSHPYIYFKYYFKTLHF